MHDILISILLLRMLKLNMITGHATDNICKIADI